VPAVERLVLPHSLFALVLALMTGIAAAEEKAVSPDVDEPPAYDQFLVIPLRVHLLQSKDLPEVDCALSDTDVDRIIGKVNGIWHKAGIHWGVESLRREPAARENRFKVARSLGDARNLGLFRILLPDESQKFDGLHVYFLHKFPVNGVWLGDGNALEQVTAKLRPVPGGIDEPVPRVTAHELGHALGLAHRQNLTNLLASGTSGTRLNADEVARAREGARAVKGGLPVAELRAAARQAAERGDAALARRLWTWLAEIPGDGAAEARRQLDALTPPRP
jgi:hypothetical protein